LNIRGDHLAACGLWALPGFFPLRKSPQVRKHPVELELPNLGVDPGLSREQLDRLCWEILKPAVEK
jgi:hypothetical protein